MPVRLLVGAVVVVAAMQPQAVRRLLARGATPTVDEEHAALPGDDLVPGAIVATHAITIDAPPAEVWPWLVQMGCDRAGWYSVDRLDNGGRPSADRIVPELQGLAVGDAVPGWPGHRLLMHARLVEPERALVLEWRGRSSALSWGFYLTPHDRGVTRLVVRLRAHYPQPGALVVRALLPGHDVMQPLQLRRIRARIRLAAERRSLSPRSADPARSNPRRA